jgi:hypothetical protein
MSDRVNLSITSREQQRREIEQQVEMFLRRGGSIDVLGTARIDAARPIGPVWWDSRGSGSLPIGL